MNTVKGLAGSCLIVKIIRWNRWWSRDASLLSPLRRWTRSVIIFNALSVVEKLTECLFLACDTFNNCCSSLYNFFSKVTKSCSVTVFDTALISCFSFFSLIPVPSHGLPSFMLKRHQAQQNRLNPAHWTSSHLLLQNKTASCLAPLSKGLSNQRLPPSDDYFYKTFTFFISSLEALWKREEFHVKITSRWSWPDFDLAEEANSCWVFSAVSGHWGQNRAQRWPWTLTASAAKLLRHFGTLGMQQCLVLDFTFGILSLTVSADKRKMLRFMYSPGDHTEQNPKWFASKKVKR